MIGNNAYHLPQILSFDHSLYDELILHIFSHLSWVDLCRTQATNRNWARLAGDNELWRNLYLKVYGRTRLRGAKGFIGRLDGRQVRPLPGRARAEEQRDWKWMFRISSNWRKGTPLMNIYILGLHLSQGRCVVENCADATFHPSSPRHLITAVEIEERTHIILAGALTITASSQPSRHPVIIVTGQLNQHFTLEYHGNEDSTRSPAYITAMALDQSPPPSGNLSMACFLSSGEFTIFEFNHSYPSHITRKCTHKPDHRNMRPCNTIHVVYYHPLLVSLSDDFSLSIYDLSSGGIQESQTLSSFTSYPPASLVLSSPSPGVFKLVIAYATPVYPKHWSVGATELIISSSSDTPPASSGSTLFSSPSFKEDYKYSTTTKMSVISNRTIRAFDVPMGWVNDSFLRAMREQWGRKLTSVADAQTDGKWVVLAPGDNIHYQTGTSPLPSSHFLTSSISSPLHSPTSLQLYRLILPTQGNSISTSPPKLTFVRSLHGQTSPVSCLALADGRCVSLGLNGSIWVWDLEGGTGAEVAPADDLAMDQTGHATKGTVSFDERRIVTARAGKLVVRRFDI